MSNVAQFPTRSDTYRDPYAQRGEDAKQVKSSALRLLARREYSRLELFRKLSVKYSSADIIQAVLDELQDQGYQSDSRFTEMFIRHKVSSGNGPFKIKIELREKGICESTTLAIFDRMNVDWFDVVDQVAIKRFGLNASSSPDFNGDTIEKDEEPEVLSEEFVAAQLAKKIRYLKSKGFYQEHINSVLSYF